MTLFLISNVQRTRPCVLLIVTSKRALRAVKLLQYVIANLNLTRFSFFSTPVDLPCWIYFHAFNAYTSPMHIKY